MRRTIAEPGLATRDAATIVASTQVLGGFTPADRAHAPDDVVAPDAGGLSEQDAVRRRARGLGNRLPPATGRTYRRIVRENVFTFINEVIFVLCLALLALGQWSDALVSIAVISVNVLVGVVQEIRAKRVLDRIAVLTRPKATVLRDGTEREIDPAEIVVGDVLVIRPGDQVLVDGPIVGSGRIDADESLLTGEADPISRGPGDELHSGTFDVSGTTRYLARAVGDDCLANRLTVGARAFRRVQTPLQRQIRLIVRVLLLIAGSFGVMLVAAAMIDGLPPVQIVRIAVVVAGLVPNGLFLAMAAAYAIGAVRIAGQGALVQQSNAIESLSNVDVLCFDKTGTLTSGRLEVVALRAFAVGEDVARRLVGGFAASVTASNRTSRAIAAGCPADRLPVRDEVPFDSARRWSAIVLDDPSHAELVLGAPEALRPRLAPDARAAVDAAVADATTAALRVVLLGRGPAVDAAVPPAVPALPVMLTPIALVTLRDELRPDVRTCLAGFADVGIAIKLVSGDHPETVRAVATQAGVPPAGRVVLGEAIGAADDGELRRLVREGTVFARVTPQQKERLVGALRDDGRYVAMVGDGVNDVPALKRSDLAIALNGGAPAARAVADLVLLNDSFATLPAAFREGQRIQNGMQGVLRLFLSRIAYMVLLIAGAALVDAAFPFTPKQNAVVTLFTVGVPAIALAAWARPAPARRRLVSALARFVAPAGWSLALVGLVFYLAYLLVSGSSELAQSALTALSVFGGVGLLLFASPPGHDAAAPDVVPAGARSAVLASLLLLGFVWVALHPDASRFFDLAPLSEADLAIAAIVAMAWAGVLRWIWRAQLLDRLLGVDLLPAPGDAVPSTRT
ncbi:MAG TPA: HAD-IC family P-type ATPase [Candidatus Saccharimonadales bacterium]|nr:HAD-IC family P-type ATPase [Candidatus Saccharimonadales bacterium]